MSAQTPNFGFTVKADTSAAIEEIRALRLELQKAAHEAERLAENFERVHSLVDQLAGKVTE